MTDHDYVPPPPVICVCSHPAADHERNYGSHQQVCLGTRAEGAPMCSCEACVYDRETGEPLADYCACRRFRAAPQKSGGTA